MYEYELVFVSRKHYMITTNSELAERLANRTLKQLWQID